MNSLLRRVAKTTHNGQGLTTFQNTKAASFTSQLYLQTRRGQDASSFRYECRSQNHQEMGQSLSEKKKGAAWKLIDCNYICCDCFCCLCFVLCLAFCFVFCVVFCDVFCVVVLLTSTAKTTRERELRIWIFSKILYNPACMGSCKRFEKRGAGSRRQKRDSFFGTRLSRRVNSEFPANS